MDPGVADRVRRLAFEHGDTYASYLATEDDREYFFAGGVDGVVSFRRRGRYVVAGSGLLAAPEDRDALLGAFQLLVEQNGWHAIYVNVPRNEIGVYRARGCQVTKVGEEPLVCLEDREWRGKEAEWVRRQENYCRRQGLEMREVDPDPDCPEYRGVICPQLEAISEEHVAATLHHGEMEFFVSRFDAADMRDRRLFVAERGSRVEAFIVCNPGLGGEFWAVEVYRRRADAPRGAVPATIMHAMRQLQAEGVRFFSLSLCPFLRCTPVAGDSPVLRSVLNFWWRRLNAVYDVQGLFHFKSRFRPEYREMFVASSPGVTVRSMLVLARMWRLLRFNPLRLAGRELRRLRAGHDRVLATPEPRGQRMVRDLRSYRSRRRVGAEAQASAEPVAAGLRG